MKIINDAERVAEKDIWSLMQFTENLRRQYGKEPRSMEIFLKKLYLRRMAADLGITRIYSSGKIIYMKTNMSKKVFKMMTESMTSDLHRNSLVLEGDQIKVLHRNSLVPCVISFGICLCILFSFCLNRNCLFFPT